MSDEVKRTSLEERGVGTSGEAARTAVPIPINTRYRETTAAGESAGVSGLFNQAARLKPGHLLVVFLAHNACYQVDPDNGEIEYLFTLTHEQSPFLWRVVAVRDGSMYCTLSGIRNTDLPTQDAVFGMAGAVLRLEHRLAKITVVAAGDDLQDPCGLQVVDDKELLVTDFSGFGGTGRIYTVDRLTGRVRTVAQGGLLADPVSAFQDDGGTLWVANSYMHYTYPSRGGVIEKDDGEILAITSDKRQRVVYARQSPPQGSIVGMNASNDPGKVIAIKGDWPVMETGGVLRVDKSSGAVDVLLSASPQEPRFYSTHVGVKGDVLWVGESYRKEIIGYDLKKKKVAKVLDFSGVMGRYRGVGSSFEGIESVSIIPADINT